MRHSHDTRQRDTLALSFEPTDGGFFYYHYRWSRGIFVAPEEREQYLDIPIFGSRREWRKSLIGRETVAPRAYFPVVMKLMKVLPLRMSVCALILGAFALLAGLNHPSATVAIALFSAGAAMLFFGGSIIAVRFQRQ